MFPELSRSSQFQILQDLSQARAEPHKPRKVKSQRAVGHAVGEAGYIKANEAKCWALREIARDVHGTACDEDRTGQLSTKGEIASRSSCEHLKSFLSALDDSHKIVWENSKMLKKHIENIMVDAEVPIPRDCM